jgi:membrane-bound inhibitor of C-type lysozyme
MKLKIIFLVAIIIVVGVISYRWSGKFLEKDTQTTNQTSTIKATYHCSADKTINAEFGKEKVNLVLSDNRKIELPQALSASGARYANSDESFVFWNKGDTAFIEENGQTTFVDCLTTGEN